MRSPILLLTLMMTPGLSAQKKEANYDESLVPEYVLPDPLRFEDGRQVTAASWPARRQELIGLFEEYVYGKVPGTLAGMEFEVLESDTVFAGAALRRQVRIVLDPEGAAHPIDLLLYLPNGVSGPLPVIVSMNFYGNHTVHPDPGILLTETWLPNSEEYHIDENRATEASRGARAFRWAIPEILARGYAFVTFYRGDLDPDRPDHWRDGVHPLFYFEGQQQPESEEWGAIAAWAWGYSRAIDYLETLPELDTTRIVAVGHSRLGKAVLWAGANDPRIDLVVSNNSGAGGAALSRRAFGETVGILNNNFPHWFNDRFPDFNGREDSLPVDQHQLIALIAPRPVYVASAIDDRWADPKGEYLSAYHAGEVYRLLGETGLENEDSPPVDTPLQAATVGYHLRTGGHDVTVYDWERFLDFADRHLGANRRWRE